VTRGAAAAGALAAFLTALHQPAPAAAPGGGDRGGALAGHADGFGRGLAAAPAWDGPPLWLHGDLHPASVLIGNAGDHGRAGGKPTWGPPARAAVRRRTATA
jgi:hypothetical protein